MSNGCFTLWPPTEGSVSRIFCVRRQMYTERIQHSRYCRALNPGEKVMPKSRVKGPKRKPPKAGRTIKITPRMAEMIEAQLELFRLKFGREPGPDDPVFFDPNAPGADPVPLNEADIRADVLRTMEKIGTPPAFAYAFAKTGFLISTENLERGVYPKAVLDEWNAAVAEYERLEAERNRG